MVVRAGYHGTINQSSALLIKNSLRFDMSGTPKLTKTVPGAATDGKKCTLSFWMKKCEQENGGSPAARFMDAYSGTGNQFHVQFGDGSSADIFALSPGENPATEGIRQSDAQFRDNSAWYHFMWRWDSVNGISKIYANGVELTSSSYTVAPTTNSVTSLTKSGTPIQLGKVNSNAVDMYVAEFHVIDGQVLDPSYFGFTDPLTNTWRPKKYEGTYGANGFYLDFSDPNNIGADRSGNGYNFTPSGLGVDDVVPDSPSGIAFSTDSTSGITTVSQKKPTNWCTLNPLNRAINDLFDGNLVATRVSGTGFAGATGTLAASSGKWYYEVTASTAAGMIGMVASSWTVNLNSALWWNNATGYGFYGVSGNKFNNGSNSAYGSSWSNGDVIGVAMDLDNGAIYFAVNNTWQNSGDPTSGSSATGAAYSGIAANEFTPIVYAQDATAGDYPVTANFGQQPFKYIPPEGYKTLCVANLPRPTEAAVRPDKYFDVVTYTGTSAGTQTVSGLNFQPDLVWLKHRESGSSGHIWTDTVRGAGTAFFSNNTSSQDTNAAAGYLSAFNSNGFTLSDGSSNGNRVKNDGSNYVAWCWKGGGGSGSGGEFWIDGVQYASAAAAGLDGGTNTPSGASINTESGFSIITYTGDSVNGARTISHGLGKKPEFVIIRNQNSTNSGGDWIIGHKGLATNAFANTKFLKFDTSSTFTNANVFGAEPTTTLLQITADGDAGATNIMDNGNPFIIYSWCSIPGFSKFGSYTGNNSSNGVIVECGFRPALVWIRSTSTSRNFLVDDATRNPYNGKVNTSAFSTNYAALAANLGSAEPQSSAGTFEGNYIDYLSNGFKLRSNSGNSNGSETYVFAAFAEAPTFNLYGGQANAR